MNSDDVRTLYGRIDRNVRTAETYVKKARNLLYTWEHVAPKQPMAAAYWTLVEQLLDTAHEIVERLPSDWFETTTERSFFDGSSFEFNHAEHTVGERLAKLNELYERRVKDARLDARIRALENTTGRTPEEAAAYQAKADELRGKAVATPTATSTETADEPAPAR